MHREKAHPKIFLPVLVVLFLLMFLSFNNRKAYAVTEDIYTPTASVTPTAVSVPVLACVSAGCIQIDPYTISQTITGSDETQQSNGGTFFSAPNFLKYTRPAYAMLYHHNVIGDVTVTNRGTCGKHVWIAFKHTGSATRLEGLSWGLPAYWIPASGGMNTFSYSTYDFNMATNDSSSTVMADKFYIAQNSGCYDGWRFGATYSITTIVSMSPIINTPTPTATATLTPTPTATTTFTPTSTNTPPPNYGGSGTCWASAGAWAGYTVPYTIDRNTIPVSFGWDSSIYAAAQAWNDVTPSHFVFFNSSNSNNTIYYETPLGDPYYLAEVEPYVISLVYITYKNLRINPYYSWDTNNTPLLNNPNSNGSSTTYNIQNMMTHELGHFLQLNHPTGSSCGDVTMYESADFGEINKISLETNDMEAINWQYP